MSCDQDAIRRAVDRLLPDICRMVPEEVRTFLGVRVRLVVRSRLYRYELSDLGGGCCFTALGAAEAIAEIACRGAC